MKRRQTLILAPNFRRYGVRGRQTGRWKTINPELRLGLLDSCVTESHIASESLWISSEIVRRNTYTNMIRSSSILYTGVASSWRTLLSQDQWLVHLFPSLFSCWYFCVWKENLAKRKRNEHVLFGTLHASRNEPRDTSLLLRCKVLLSESLASFFNGQTACSV